MKVQSQGEGWTSLVGKELFNKHHLKETNLLKNIDITANQMGINQGYRVIGQMAIYVFKWQWRKWKYSSPVVGKTSLS